MSQQIKKLLCLTLLASMVGMIFAVKSSSNQDKQNNEKDVAYAKRCLDFILNDGQTQLPAEGKYGNTPLTWNVKSGNATIKEGIIFKTIGASDNEPITLSCVVGKGKNAVRFDYKSLILKDRFELYLMSYFDTDRDQTGLCLGYSYDGVNWMPLNDGNPIMHATLGTKRLRDPNIFRLKDGTFGLVSTQGWDNQTIYAFDSPDLITFNNERLLAIQGVTEERWKANKEKYKFSSTAFEIEGAGSGSAWAPEAIYSPEKGAYLIYWSDTWSNNGKHAPIMGNWTEDLTNQTLSDPFILFDVPNYQMIDANILKEDGTYVMTVKNDFHTTSGIIKRFEMATAQTLDENSFIASEQGAIISSIMDSKNEAKDIEGASAFKNLTPNVDGSNNYFMYFDPMEGDSDLAYGMTNTFLGGTWSSQWSTTTPNYRVNKVINHVTIIPITQKELNKLVEAHGLGTTMLFESDAITVPKVVNVDLSTDNSTILEQLPQTIVLADPLLLRDGRTVSKVSFDWNLKQVSTKEIGSYNAVGLVKIGDPTLAEMVVLTKICVGAPVNKMNHTNMNRFNYVNEISPLSILGVTSTNAKVMQTLASGFILEKNGRTISIPISQYDPHIKDAKLTFNLLPGSSINTEMNALFDLTKNTDIVVTAGGVSKTYTVTGKITHNSSLPGTSATTENSGNIQAFAADPEIIIANGKYYIYATMDVTQSPDMFTRQKQYHVYESTDLASWKDMGVVFDVDDNTEDFAEDALWAPAVEQGADGKFYLYFTARSLSEKAVAAGGTYNQLSIGVAVSDTPTGRFKTVSNRPLINTEQAREIVGGGIGCIDAEIFTDTDGRVYFYAGNGRLIHRELDPSMIKFKEDTEWKVIDMSKHYFNEGTVVAKRGNKYFFSWSNGDTWDKPLYNSRWGWSDSPSGPIHYGGQLIKSKQDIGLVAPGHHSVLNIPGTDKWYLVYHRHSTLRNDVVREVCIDEIHFDSNEGAIEIVPTLEGVSPVNIDLKQAVLQITSIQSANLKLMKSMENSYLYDEKTKSYILPISQYDSNIKTAQLTIGTAPGTKSNIDPKAKYDLTKPLNVVLRNGKDKETYTLKTMITYNSSLPGAPDNGNEMIARVADPETIYENGKYYIYPTNDGWDANQKAFHVYESEDLSEWKDLGLAFELSGNNSKTWARNALWAPSVEKGADGKFYLYFAAKGDDELSNIGVAVANTPVGPFHILEEKPLLTYAEYQEIAHNLTPESLRIDNYETKTRPYGQAIDAEVFTDEDGEVYFYVGNYTLLARKLDKNTMSSFNTNSKWVDLTEPIGRKYGKEGDFCEGVVATKRNGKYYFSWSSNGTNDPNYKSQWGISDTPLGPIEYKGVMIQKSPELGITSTGHHSVVNVPNTDDWYIVYHRWSTTNGGAGIGAREVCIDKIEFDTNGNIVEITPTLEGVKLKIPTQ